MRSFLTEPDCDHVTDAYLRYKRGVSQQSRDEHCEAFRKRVKPVDEDKIGSVKVKSKEGDRAVVLATAKESGDAGALFTLRRQDGEWRIDSGPRPYVEPE